MFLTKQIFDNIFSLSFKDKNFKIYFGNAGDNILKSNIMAISKEKDICDIDNFANIKKIVGFKDLLFLNQVHSSEGVLVNGEPDFKSFEKDGDFLVTNIKNCAIGVLTADCLPIVFIDNKKGVVAVSHAGWRGSVENIACKTIESMQKNFDSELEDIKIFFGPSIKKCCYRVSNDFEKNLAGYDFINQVLTRFTEKNKNCINSNCEKEFEANACAEEAYFDLPKFNFLLLQKYGVPKENIELKYNTCTCCNKEYFSYRRGDLESRQATIICFVN